MKKDKIHSFVTHGQSSFFPKLRPTPKVMDIASYFTIVGEGIQK